jgi:hypothetical protein
MLLIFRPQAFEAARYGLFEFFTVAEEFLVSREITSADDAADVEEIFLTCLPASP